MNIVAWLIVGLIAGAIARLLVPGRDRLGFAGTIVLGLVGSLIGGFIGGLITPGDQAFEPAGLLGSILGAVIVLFLYRVAVGRRRFTRRRIL